MGKRTQAEVEAQLDQRWSQVQSGAMTEEEAFGDAENWMIQLENRELLLHPGDKRWFWYDRIHGEWEDSGFGVGEAIFVVIGGVAGAKRVPQEGQVEGQTAEGKPPSIGDWYIYVHEEELSGPIPEADLRKRLAEGVIPADVLVWSANATDWQRAAAPSPPQWPPPAPAVPPPPAKPATALPRPRAAPLPLAGATCPNCGAPLSPGQRFCGECGAAVEPPRAEAPKQQFYTKPICPNCGIEYEKGKKFCRECGSALVERPSQAPPPPTGAAPGPPPAAPSYQAPPPPPAAPPVEEKKSKTWLWVGCGCLVLILVCIAVGLFVVYAPASFWDALIDLGIPVPTGPF